MKKAILMLLLSALLLTSLGGCAEKIEMGGISTAEEIVASEFSDPFYGTDVPRGEESLSNREIMEILAKVPADQYEAYPDLHNIPLTATLYKDGEVIEIDVKDRRLIRMINFYNNSIYHCQHSYTTGSLDPQGLEKVENAEYRLVLTYTPFESEIFDSHFDTIIVTNERFVGISYDIPFGEGVYPFTAFGKNPLYQSYPWLDLFEF